jgi:hypothetical protein
MAVVTFHIITMSSLFAVYFGLFAIAHSVCMFVASSPRPSVCYCSSLVYNTIDNI